MNTAKFVLIAAAVAAALFLGCLLVIPRAEAADSSTQEFTPSRYALIAAEINVSSLQQGIGQNTRQVLVKTDTLTGQCWILELQVGGFGNFHVERAHWRPTANAIPYQP